MDQGRRARLRRADYTGRLGAFATTSDLYLRDPRWYEVTRAPLAKDRTLPFFRYVVMEKGKVEIGILACGMCHTRVLPDRSLLKGAQGNFPGDRALAYDYRTLNDIDEARAVQLALGDDRAIRSTYVAGRLAWYRDAAD